MAETQGAMRTSLRPPPEPPAPQSPCTTCGTTEKRSGEAANGGPKAGVAGPAPATLGYHPQSKVDTCAIASARMLIFARTGKDVSEGELTRRATELGIYEPGEGSATSRMPELLHEYGVETTNTDLKPGSSDLRDIAAPERSFPLNYVMSPPPAAITPSTPAILSIRQEGSISHAVVVDSTRTTATGLEYRVTDPDWVGSRTPTTWMPASQVEAQGNNLTYTRVGR